MGMEKDIESRIKSLCLVNQELTKGFASPDGPILMRKDIRRFIQALRVIMSKGRIAKRYRPSVFLSSGTFSVCYECRDKTSVIKTNIFSDAKKDGMIYWLRECISNPGPYKPKIHFYYEIGDKYFVIMERLYSYNEEYQRLYKEVLPKDLSALVLKMSKHIGYDVICSSDIAKEFRNKLEEHRDKIIVVLLLDNFSAMYQLVESVVEGINSQIIGKWNFKISVDLCVENIMLRKVNSSYEIIITDPFWYS